MKIFCIGFNKTGSTSLHVAIKELGFAEIYELEGGITNWTNVGKETQK